MGIDDSRFLQKHNILAINSLVDEALAFNVPRLNFLSIETKLLLLSVRKTNKATGQEYAWAHLVDLPQLQLFTRVKMVWEARVHEKKLYRVVRKYAQRRAPWTHDPKMLRAGSDN